MALTPRGKDLRWLTRHRYLTEQPYGSNTDTRPDGIRAAQLRLAPWLVGKPWCGTWAASGLIAAGVQGVSWRLASVALIEDDARAGRAPFVDWLDPGEWRRVMRGDLVVWFGRGVHVETVRSFKRVRGAVYCRTDGGNTSSGTAGSQSSGGGSYPRWRPLSQAHGFCRVDYPGGWVRPRAERFAMAVEARLSRVDYDGEQDASVPSEASDRRLVSALQGADEAGARALLAELEARRP